MVTFEGVKFLHENDINIESIVAKIIKFIFSCSKPSRTLFSVPKSTKMNSFNIETIVANVVKKYNMQKAQKTTLEQWEARLQLLKEDVQPRSPEWVRETGILFRSYVEDEADLSQLYRQTGQKIALEVQRMAFRTVSKT
ncbi:unnamed protein product [Caenorhabditis auriculariae]|uniref:Uncharacterized protein n=1 Tax=Caenorhabditis auriculariae TaxID=2777116 RepID=A0A8S1HRI4_9PELO|nr:unnamed protein product [Caenorhabditis auriculariae]